MINYIRKHKVLSIISCLLIIALITGSILLVSSRNKLKLLDTSAYKELVSSIQESADSGDFYDQNALRKYITSWADDNGLKYKLDSSDNIILNTKAAARKKNVSPSVICVSYNYQTAASNAELLASAAMIAKTEINTGRKTVVFVNDEQNLGTGFEGLDKKYFSGKTKVIYLDQGAAYYISRSSFGRNNSTISIPYKRVKVKCDTAIQVHISGIQSDVITTSASDHPDPSSAFSELLTRLKSKSVTFQLADFNYGTNGNMYPVSLDATFVLNSHAVSSFTKFIDRTIKNWNKQYSADYPELTFTYEILDDDEIPSSAYSKGSTEKLANVLYTVKSGEYAFGPDDDIPEGLEEGYVYGTNLITDIRWTNENIIINLVTMAYNSDCMDRIANDNQASAELFDCSYTVTDKIPAFKNDTDSLQRTLTKTFYKVNDITGANNILKELSDNYFTPCAYLATKSSGLDIVHIKINPKKASVLTNTILCYIATKGNFFSLQ